MHGVDAEGATILRKQVRRAQVLGFFGKLPRCLVELEACATAHYWARELRALGHEVRPMPARYLKAYVKRNQPEPDAVPQYRQRAALSPRCAP